MRTLFSATVFALFVGVLSVGCDAYGDLFYPNGGCTWTQCNVPSELASVWWSEQWGNYHASDGQCGILLCEDPAAARSRVVGLLGFDPSNLVCRTHGPRPTGPYEAFDSCVNASESPAPQDCGRHMDPCDARMVQDPPTHPRCCEPLVCDAGDDLADVGVCCLDSGSPCDPAASKCCDGIACVPDGAGGGECFFCEQPGFPCDNAGGEAPECCSGVCDETGLCH